MARLVQSDNRKKQMDKQIGCMSGFLLIFDRQQILAGKRIHSSKRLPPPTGVGEIRETVKSVDSREISRELKKPESLKQVAVVLPTSSDTCQLSPDENINHRGISPVVKTCNKEMPRLSLDSERSPSVIARLMGLETFSSSDQKSMKSVSKPELMRSNSESWVCRGLVRSKYIDRNNFQVKVPSLLHKQNVENNVKLDSSRSLFDSADFYPERKNQKVVLVKGDFEKKLKMNGLEEQNTDLTTLRQILEVLQLKGLLHSSKNRESLRTFVFDRNTPSDNHTFGDYQVRRSPKPEVRKSSPTRIESNLKSCNSIVKRKPLSIEIRRRANESFERSSPSNSPKVTPKKSGSSPRNYKQTESVSVNSRKKKLIKHIKREDESSSISESNLSTPSTTDSEKSKWDGYKDGKSLLQRCDKLLHSIAEMNMNSETESPPSSTTVLPSPVSVLDSGFDKDEMSSPSNSIDIKATSTVDLEDDTSSIQSISRTILKTIQHNEEEFTLNDPEFMYISKILQASQDLINIDSNIFYSLEKQLYNDENTSNVSKSERKLIFDVIIEILDTNKHLPPWKALNGDSLTSLKCIWSEFQKIREINISDHEILDLISVVLKKDLVEMNGWKDYPIETSESVLDVERMIFKDLMSEAIGDFVEVSGKCVYSRAQRRLVF